MSASHCKRLAEEWVRKVSLKYPEAETLAAERALDAALAATVRAAVAAERESIIAALEALNGWCYEDPASSAIQAIRARGNGAVTINA